PVLRVSGRLVGGVTSPITHVAFGSTWNTYEINRLRGTCRFYFERCRRSYAERAPTESIVVGARTANLLYARSKRQIVDTHRRGVVVGRTGGAQRKSLFINSSRSSPYAKPIEGLRGPAAGGIRSRA